MTVINWVENRANCKLDLTFDALKEVVERDVSAANKLPVASRHSWFFYYEISTGGANRMIRVRRKTNGDDETFSVTFKETESAIEVTFSDDWMEPFRVTARWDRQEHCCRLLLDGRPFEVWHISEKALEPLFFDPELQTKADRQSRLATQDNLTA